MVSMKLSGVYNAYNIYSSKKSQPIRVSRAEEKRDMVALSSKAKDFQSVMKALSNVPDVRMDKVTELKSKIDSNQYFVNSQDIADKMLSKLDS